ncbi:hypothetical protein L207DRAFT_640521 [Hyaloscypha variabilis F]|uniref:Peptidase A2 domain-containing protein n=1 Tax=Hyaloscypha variabilis (strain UAMH 11265 / GT02V1 / F) TaxID=1149755 RepID=A0A2J6QZJ3_HYAVF|nr:hypothetical protein L207DRAFT_640521 [Hyaloscypha variabilis F]
MRAFNPLLASCLLFWCVTTSSTHASADKTQATPFDDPWQDDLRPLGWLSKLSQDNFPSLFNLGKLLRKATRSPSRNSTSRQPEKTFDTHARAIILGEDNKNYTFCADTGAYRSIISKPTLLAAFPSAPLTDLPANASLRCVGISGGEGLLASSYATVSPRMLTMDGEVVTFLPLRLYVVEKMPGGMILGLDFLRANRLHFRWGGDGLHDCLQVGETGGCVRLFTKCTVMWDGGCYIGKQG